MNVNHPFRNPVVDSRNMARPIIKARFPPGPSYHDSDIAPKAERTYLEHPVKAGREDAHVRSRSRLDPLVLGDTPEPQIKADGNGDGSQSHDRDDVDVVDDGHLSDEFLDDLSEEVHASDEQPENVNDIRDLGGAECEDENPDERGGDSSREANADSYADAGGEAKTGDQAQVPTDPAGFEAFEHDQLVPLYKKHYRSMNTVQGKLTHLESSEARRAPVYWRHLVILAKAHLNGEVKLKPCNIKRIKKGRANMENGRPPLNYGTWPADLSVVKVGPRVARVGPSAVMADGPGKRRRLG